MVFHSMFSKFLKQGPKTAANISVNSLWSCNQTSLQRICQAVFL